MDNQIFEDVDNYIINLLANEDKALMDAKIIRYKYDRFLNATSPARTLRNSIYLFT
jgi:hypothetical protein